MRNLLCAVTLLLLLPLSAAAQQSADEKKPPKPKPDCLDGTKYDDGKLESGLKPGSVLYRGNLAMLFEAPQYPAKLEKLCVAWTKTFFDFEVFYDVRIWAADGPDGAPGTLLTTVPLLYAGRVPGKPKFYNYDVTGLNIVIDGPVYIGPSWYARGNSFWVYLAMDTGPSTPRRRAFYGIADDRDDEPPSRELGSLDNVPNYRAFGIRAKFGPP